MTLLPFKCAHHIMKYYYITVYCTGLIIVFLEYVNDSLKIKLFNTVWEIFAEYFKKILQAYVGQLQN